MVDVMKQAVARVSKVFLDGVSELLGHAFSAEERLELCGELEAFMTLTIVLIQTESAVGREGHEVVDEVLDEVLGDTSPAMVKAILDIAGESPEGAAEKLVPHVRAFFMLASMLMMALDRQKQKKEE